MIGILIVSHGGFGEALVHSASHVLGRRPPQVQQMGVGLKDDPDRVLSKARELLRQVDTGEGVLILTDMLGATPSNVATRLLEAGRVEGLAGASLPMLIRALTYRDEPLAAVVAKAVSGGHEGVVHLTTDVCNAANRG
ncbi:MAG TPA: PTS sugar transporter subunit IIA [Burkholderiales bacterium]|nr:PTS sugar transporter subunit IIA [Burkholderiales bacterium]